MLKDENCIINITPRNITYYKNKNYTNIKVGESISIKTSDINTNSKTKIVAICEICGYESYIGYDKYILNKNRNNYSYYGCFRCSRLKAEATNLEIYGTIYPMQNETIKNRVSMNNFIKYDVTTTLLCPDVIEKTKQTISKKYCVEYGTPILSIPSIKQLSIQTCNEKYNNDRYSGSVQHKKLGSEKTWIKNTTNKLHRYGYSYVDYLLDTVNREIIIECSDTKCSKLFSITPKNLYQRTIIYGSVVCTVCNSLKTNSCSIAEQEIIDYIKSIYNGPILLSDKTVLGGKHIDIYLPERGIGFEYNGMYWHSERFKTKYYHIQKTHMCLEKNIDLYHIFESCYKTESDKRLTKSVIYNIINISDKISYMSNYSISLPKIIYTDNKQINTYNSGYIF